MIVFGQPISVLDSMAMSQKMQFTAIYIYIYIRIIDIAHSHYSNILLTKNKKEKNQSSFDQT